MKLTDVLTAAIADSSAYATAKNIGVSPQTFYRWQNGQRNPSDEQLDKLVELSGYTVKQVYLAAYAERLGNPVAVAAFRHLAS